MARRRRKPKWQASRWLRNVWVLRVRSIWDFAHYNYYVLVPPSDFWLWAGLSTFLLLIGATSHTTNVLLGASLPAGLLSVAAVVLGAAVIVAQYLKARSVDRIESVVKTVNPNVRLKLESAHVSQNAKDDGFMVVKSPPSCPDGPVMVSETFNCNCAANPAWDPKLKISRSRERYGDIIDELRRDRRLLRKYVGDRMWKAFWTPRPLVNEKKVGFGSQLRPDTREVLIYPTDYFTGMCTADLTENDLHERTADGKCGGKYRGIERSSYLQRDESLEILDFQDTSKPCSIHGGIEVWAISSDGYLRIALQNKFAQVSQYMRAPSGSGSMDWTDLEGSTTLKQLILRAAKRELLEEQANDPSSELGVARMEVIGFFRMLHRGAKPQFVVLAKLDSPISAMRNDPSEVDIVQPFPARSFTELSSSAESMLKSASYQDSVPYVGAVLCLQQAIKNNPELIQRVIGCDL
jgi:hypothetical protein